MKTQINETYKVETYKLETLSPVHIGTGNKYTNWDYFVESGDICIISLDRFIEQLTEEQQELLAKFIENKGNSRKGVQDFINNENINKGTLINSVIYKIRLKDKGQIHGIWEEIKHPEGLYIPASTIKGAIRTAVLYCLLKENEDNYIFSVEKFKTKNGKEYKDIVLNTKYKKVQGIDNIQNFLEREFFGENQSNDIFKYLRISDSDVEKGFNSLECRKIYVANTTKFQDKNGRIRKHPEYYEVISEGTEFKNIKISIISEKESLFKQSTQVFN